jgi:hypothetical protein
LEKKKRREIEKKGREKQRNRQTERIIPYDPSCRTWSSGSSEVFGGENK